MSRREREHSALPIPNGWFALAFSRDLVPGEVRDVHAFGEDLVLFRTRAGHARVLDAYCPHLGAHLGEGGRVSGESVRCPFHGWEFDGATGRCTAIPYCDRIPPRARLRAWDVCERNGMIFAWHHAEEKPPEWDFPELPELSDPAWIEPRAHAFELPAPVQDSHENNNDPVHFQTVHKMPTLPETRIEYGDGGRFMRVVHEHDRETPIGKLRMSLVNDSWGLGLVAVRTRGIPGLDVMMYSSTTPIDATRSISRWLLTCTRSMADLAGEEVLESYVRGVRDDLPIWKRKVHRADPVLCEADRFLAEYRAWVRQFYSQPAGAEQGREA
jgi:phenylpropionate dioxygenase-like ring-hydroxylating dioxygenase large terminal subunit